MYNNSKTAAFRQYVRIIYHFIMQFSVSFAPSLQTYALARDQLMRSPQTITVENIVLQIGDSIPLPPPSELFVSAV